MTRSDIHASAILGKSLLLHEKLRERVKRVNSEQFPTKASSHAQEMLAHALELLSEAPAAYAPSPSVFHRQVFALHELVHLLESSSCDLISWPVVSYCDDMWKKLFGGEKRHVFFAHTAQHNYGLFRFSRAMYRHTENVLPSSKIDWLRESDLYCLLLASLEEDNIPLYANIAHEFGHVVYDLRMTEVHSLWMPLSRTMQKKMDSQIEERSGGDSLSVLRRKRQTRAALENLVKELTSDVAGAILLGPSFFLSLNEMAWGSDVSKWSVDLVPALQHITAYPSFEFRLECVRRVSNLTEFCKSVEPELEPLGIVTLSDLGRLFSGICPPPKAEAVVVRPEPDDDRKVLEEVLTENLSGVREALLGFVNAVADFLRGEFQSKGVAFTPIPREVAELILRLKNHVPPNIIPDGTLLGRPADFPSILLAASLYRISLLAAWPSDQAGQRRTTDSLARIERLTAKAFEVSYVQHEYNRWRSSGGASRGSAT